MQREEGKANGKVSDAARRGSLRQKRIEDVYEDKSRRERELPSCSNAGFASTRRASETQGTIAKRKQRDSLGEKGLNKRTGLEKEKENREAIFNRSTLIGRSSEKKENTMNGEEKSRLERMAEMMGKLLLGIEENKKTLNERFNAVEEKMEMWESRWEGMERSVEKVKITTKRETDKIREEMEGNWKEWEKEAEEWKGKTLTDLKQKAEVAREGEGESRVGVGEVRRRERERKEQGAKELKYVRDLMEARDKEKKRKNIVITGLKEIGEKGKGAVEDWFLEILEVEVEIKKMWMIGVRKEKICVGLKTEECKEEIMKEKKRLEGTRIFIDHDFTWKERKMREKLRGIARQKKAEGLTVKLGYNRLWIEGKEFKWSEEMEDIFRKE